MNLLQEDFLEIFQMSEKKKSIKRIGLDYPEDKLNQLHNLFELDFDTASPISIVPCESYSTAHLEQSIETLLSQIEIVNEIRSAKKIVIKPAMIEARSPTEHATTSPKLLRQLIDTIIKIKNKNGDIMIAEGSGHERDSLLLSIKTGIQELISEYGIEFVDLNHDDLITIDCPNPLSFKNFSIPKTIVDADFIISLAPMKTHFRTAVSLGMKNLFGCLPGSIYGFPKNKLHWSSISRVIPDIASVISPQLTIIDGIVSIEGNGPLDGNTKKTGIIIGGRNVATTDLIAAKLMGFSPALIPKFWYANLKGLIEKPLISNNVINEFRKVFIAPRNIKWIEGTDLKTKTEQEEILKALIAEGNSLRT